MHRAGTNTKAPIQHATIDTTTRKPKNRMGMKIEARETEKPITTDIALNVIPLPVVVSVFNTASL